MSEPDESSQEALKRLDKRLDAIQAQRAPAHALSDPAAERGMGEGYRLLGEVIGGVLGGLGLGWVFDHFMHTLPWGLVAGLLIGTGVSAYAAMKGAERMSAAATKSGSVPGGGDDGKTKDLKD